MKDAFIFVFIVFFVVFFCVNVDLSDAVKIKKEFAILSPKDMY